MLSLLHHVASQPPPNRPFPTHVSKPSHNLTPPLREYMNKLEKRQKEPNRKIRPQKLKITLKLSSRITKRISHNRPRRKTAPTQPVGIPITARNNLRRSPAEPLRASRPHARSVRVHVAGNTRDTSHRARAANIRSWHGVLSRGEGGCCEGCVSS